MLNNLVDDVTEKQDLAKSDSKRLKELQKFAGEARRELGDWDREGRDRPTSAFPGDLNAGMKQKMKK